MNSPGFVLQLYSMIAPGSTPGIANEIALVLRPLFLTMTLSKMASLLSSIMLPSGRIVRPVTPNTVLFPA